MSKVSSLGFNEVQMEEGFAIALRATRIRENEHMLAEMHYSINSLKLREGATQAACACARALGDAYYEAESKEAQ